MVFSPFQRPILAALLYSTRAAGVRQNLGRATRNRITELSQRTPPIFGWAAITLGIGPHYCSVCFILVMAALWNRACGYIFILWFILLFSSFFRRLYIISAVTQSCRAVSSQLRHVSTSRKNLLNSNNVLHMSAQYGQLWHTKAWNRFGSLGHPSKFQRFRVLPSLLRRRRLPEVNQALHDVWPSPGLVHYVYISGALAPLTEFCPVQNSLYVLFLRYHILAALLHGTSAAGVTQTLRRCTEGAIYMYIQQGCHHVGHRPTF